MASRCLHAFFAIIMVVMMTFPTSDAFSQNGSNNTQTIKTALDALAKRTNDDAFVIFEEANTGKFVQFVGNISSGLLLNVPSQTLSADELEKAKKLFAEYGIAPEKRGNFLTGKYLDFFMELGGDKQKGAMVAMRIFKEVYGFPDNFGLRIQEN